MRSEDKEDGKGTWETKIHFLTSANFGSKLFFFLFTRAKKRVEKQIKRNLVGDYNFVCFWLRETFPFSSGIIYSFRKVFLLSSLTLNIPSRPPFLSSFNHPNYSPQRILKFSAPAKRRFAIFEDICLAKNNRRGKIMASGEFLMLTVIESLPLSGKDSLCKMEGRIDFEDNCGWNVSDSLIDNQIKTNFQLKKCQNDEWKHFINPIFSSTKRGNCTTRNWFLREIQYVWSEIGHNNGFVSYIRCWLTLIYRFNRRKKKFDQEKKNQSFGGNQSFIKVFPALFYFLVFLIQRKRVQG